MRLDNNFGHIMQSNNSVVGRLSDHFIIPIFLELLKYYFLFQVKYEYTCFNQYETGVQSLRSIARFQLSMLCLTVFNKCQLIRFKVVYSFVKLEFMFTLQFESQIPPYYTAHYIAASLLKLHNTPTVFNFSLRSIFFHAPLPQENFFPGTDFLL